MNTGAVAGLTILVVSQSATLAGIEPFASWNTPICWTGFILFADSIVFRARGNSWLRSAPGEFAALAAASIPLWLVFEFYNRFIENWYYVGLPENQALRLFGYAWAFATIWPAIFEGAELVAVWRGRSSVSSRSASARRPPAAISSAERWAMVAGAILLVWPLLWPSQYLAAPVFLGFIFLIDPINRQLGAESIAEDLRSGRHDRLINLAWSGMLCGILWEFWNYWSHAKWHYTVPITERVKIFEMPVAGYLGFAAFAIECFTMYVLARRAFTPAGRPIGL